MFLFFFLANMNVLDGTVGLESATRHIRSAVSSNHILDLTNL